MSYGADTLVLILLALVSVWFCASVFVLASGGNLQLALIFGWGVLAVAIILATILHPLFFAATFVCAFIGLADSVGAGLANWFRLERDPTLLMRKQGQSEWINPLDMIRGLIFIVVGCSILGTSWFLYLGVSNL
jgi:hypothetical protein